MVPVTGKCSSCGACANVCPKNAIKMCLDANGFFRPVIDDNLCIHCGFCERKCPWSIHVDNPNERLSMPKIFAANANDKDLRKMSSSGGIFSLLAQRILESNGVVFGVAQLSKFDFKYIIVEKKEDLKKIRGSKYIQADVGLIYKDVRSYLNQGKKVLFTGTPCQIAALYSVIGKSANENLYTIDIVCHGTPSFKVFKKHVSEIEKKNSSIVEETIFRDKCSGWNAYSVTYKMKFGNNERLITKYHRDDAFMRLFLKNFSLNEACDDCAYRKIPRIADLTLGDYWKIKNVHPELFDDLGTSVVMLNTAHGESLFNEVKHHCSWIASNLESVVVGNRSICFANEPNLKRNRFFEDVDVLTMDQLVKKYCAKPNFFQKIWNKMKRKIGR